MGCTHNSVVYHTYEFPAQVNQRHKPYIVADIDIDGRVDFVFSLLNRSSTCRESGQLCVIMLSDRVVRQYRACVVGVGIHVWYVLHYWCSCQNLTAFPTAKT